MEAITLNERIKAFETLGLLISKKLKNISPIENFDSVISSVLIHNQWFTPKSIKLSLKNTSASLSSSSLAKWVHQYKISDAHRQLNVGVIMAGNIPIVGFHDLLCVLISGNKIIAKLSSKDAILIKVLSNLLTDIDPRFASYIEFCDELPTNIDAVIATGSDNTSIYFEFYYGKLPHIIRKNRSSVALVQNNLSSLDLEQLGFDIFDYYGLGCRNVSKIYLPLEFDIARLSKAWKGFGEVFDCQPYVTNYKYQKALLKAGSFDFIDLGNVLLLKNDSINSAIAVLHYSTYSNINEVEIEIKQQSAKIQIVVGEGYYPYGTSQSPTLNDYADNVDTLKFILNLSE